MRCLALVWFKTGKNKWLYIRRPPPARGSAPWEEFLEPQEQQPQPEPQPQPQQQEQEQEQQQEQQQQQQQQL